MSRRRVARGVALGAYFAMLLPIGQIPVVVAAALVLRTNLLCGVIVGYRARYASCVARKSALTPPQEWPEITALRL